MAICVLVWASVVGFLLFLLVRFARYSDGDFTLQWLEWRGKKPGAMAAPQRRGAFWSDEEVEAMLHILIEGRMGPQVMPSTHLKNMRLFSRVAMSLGARGHHRSGDQVCSKFKRIKGDFYNAMEAFRGLPPAHSRPPYFNLLEELWIQADQPHWTHRRHAAARQGTWEARAQQQVQEKEEEAEEEQGAAAAENPPPPGQEAPAAEDVQEVQQPREQPAQEPAQAAAAAPGEERPPVMAFLEAMRADIMASIDARFDAMRAELRADLEAMEQRLRADQQACFDAMEQRTRAPEAAARPPDDRPRSL